LFSDHLRKLSGMVKPGKDPCSQGELSDVCSAALNSLGSAPPDKWGDLLAVLGASFHNTAQESDNPSPANACTVTSMLASRMGASCGDSSQPMALSTSGTAALEKKKNARDRARRSQTQANKPTAPAEADTRDLDDLLRDLGEAPANAKQMIAKKKMKGKDAPISLAKVPARAPADTATSNDSKRKKKASAPNNQQATSSIEAAEEKPDEDIEGQNEVAAEFSPNVKGLESNEQDEEDAEDTNADVGKDLAEVDHESSASLAAMVETALLASAAGSSYRRSLSEGDRPEPQRKASLQLQHAATAASSHPAAPVRTEEAWCARPSVGTWNLAPPRTRSRDAARRESPSARGGGALSSPPLAAQCPQSLPWQVRPSIGTWLHVASPRICSPAHCCSRARSRSNASMEMRLWPATPESTPPASPRRGSECGGLRGCGGVVWVPVPVHLLSEVEQLLRSHGSVGIGVAGEPSGGQARGGESGRPSPTLSAFEL